MHVLVVTIVHVPTDARIHHRQIRSLRQAGHRVTYAAPLSGYGVDRRAVDADEVIDLPRAQGRRRWRAAGAARRVIATMQDVDLVLLHDPELLMAAGAATAPVVWDVHEDTVEALADRPWVPVWLRPLVAVAARRAEQRAESRYHLLLAESAYQQRFSRSHLVVPNYPWLPDVPATLGRARVVYLGRVSRLRGGLDLVEIGRLLRPYGVEVDVIGPIDADIRADLHDAGAEGVVRLHGYVRNEDALKMLDGAVAGLSLLHDHPNYRHSMPTKILEYQAYGLPVITTPLAEARRIVEECGSGIVVPFGDPRAVADAILKLREDPDRSEVMAAAGRGAAEVHYSFDAVATGFVDALEAAASR